MDLPPYDTTCPPSRAPIGGPSVADGGFPYCPCPWRPIETDEPCPPPPKTVDKARQTRRRRTAEPRVVQRLLAKLSATVRGRRGSHSRPLLYTSLQRVASAIVRNSPWAIMPMCAMQKASHGSSESCAPREQLSSLVTDSPPCAIM